MVQETEGHVSIILKIQGGVRKKAWSYFCDFVAN